MLWLVFIPFWFTMADLFSSPVGQSLSTKLAPAASHTQMIVLFFLSVEVGTAGAGTLARSYDPNDEVSYFLTLGLASLVVGLVLLLRRKRISTMMAGGR